MIFTAGRLSPVQGMAVSETAPYAALDVGAVNVTSARWEVLLEALPDARVAAAVVRAAARSAGLDRWCAAAVATATAELATNAIKHGGGGRLEVERRGSGVWLVVEDRGAGCAAELAETLARASADPRSHGIGAVARLTDGLRLSQRQGGGLAIEVWKGVE